MYSSSPQACHYYSNSSTGKTDASAPRYNNDPSNHSSNSNGGFQGTSDTTPTSWQHMDHDYSLSSPTPTATSPSFPTGNTSTSSALSTPYVISHSSGGGHQSDRSSNSSSGSNSNNHPGFLGTPTTSPPPPPLLPSYGYGLSHRGFFPRPKLTTTLWEDERTICFQVDANGICVARREDNDMINGTKLLNVAGMSRGKRDGILKNEKGRVVVKVGAMHLKGVWITFDRAKTLSAQFKIQDVLYPLFVDNPQTFLYSHPITNPISRLGSFRSFYPSSWDRSTATPPSHQYTMEAPSNAGHEMVAPFGYRPVTSPEGPPPPAALHSSNYGDGNHDNGESIDYRPNGPPSDILTSYHPAHRPPHQRHHPSMDNSQPHDSSYYNNVNEMSFYNTNRETDKVMVSTVSSPESTNGGPSIHMNGNKRSNMGGSSSLQQPVSAFQSIDSTTIYHPQPLGMDSINSTNSNGRDSYNSHEHYLANPLSTSSSHNNNSNIVLSGNIDSTVDNPPPPSSTTTTTTTTTSSPSSPSSLVSSRRDSLVMMNHHYPRNGPPQRHHPYANSMAPPKLSSMQDYAHHSGLPPDSASAPDTAPERLRKPSITTRLHPCVPPSRPLAEELGDLSVKTESDHLSRPW